MTKKIRLASLLAVLVAMLCVNVAMAQAVDVAADAASATPCADQYAGCMSGPNPPSDFCWGQYCACLWTRYQALC